MTNRVSIMVHSHRGAVLLYAEGRLCLFTAAIIVKMMGLREDRTACLAIRPESEVASPDLSSYWLWSAPSSEVSK